MWYKMDCLQIFCAVLIVGKMGLCRVALFVSYLCLLQFDLYQGRAFDKEKTVIRLQIPLSSLTLFTGPSNGDTTPQDCISNKCQNGQKKPSAVVLSMPSSGSKRKTNIMIDMSGKNKACQYTSNGLPKNETLTVDVYVNDKQNASGVTAGNGTISTTSNSSIEDGKDGIRVIGSSKSTTPDSNLTVLVNVYIEDSEKGASSKPVITTNSSISDGKGEADADTGAAGTTGGSSPSSGESAMGSSGTESGSSETDTTITKEIVVGTIVDGSGLSDGGSPSTGSSGGGSTGSSSDGGSTDEGSSDGGSSDGGSTDGGSTDGGLTDGHSTSGGSTDGGSSSGGASDGGSTGKGPTDGASPDGGSTDGTSPDGSSAAAAGAAAAGGGDGSDATAAAAAAALSKDKGTDGGDK